MGSYGGQAESGRGHSQAEASIGCKGQPAESENHSWKYFGAHPMLGRFWPYQFCLKCSLVVRDAH